MRLTYTRDININSSSVVWLFAESDKKWVLADSYWINDFNRNKRERKFYHTWYAFQGGEHYISLDYAEL